MDFGDPKFSVTRLTGLPSFRVQSQLEEHLLEEAGLDSDASFLHDRRSPTTIHVVAREGVPVAAAVSTFGPLSEVPLGLALRESGVDVEELESIPSPVSELFSVSEDRGSSVPGITETLYRSFYQYAKSRGAESLVVGLDPWVFDLLTERYGARFEILGPIMDLLGRELIPAGARIEDLEEGIRETAPDFFEFMQRVDDLAVDVE